MIRTQGMGIRIKLYRYVAGVRCGARECKSQGLAMLRSACGHRSFGSGPTHQRTPGRPEYVQAVYVTRVLMDQQHELMVATERPPANRTHRYRYIYHRLNYRDHGAD